MTTPLRLRGFIQQFQDYIAANYSDDQENTYTVAENFTVADYVDVDDLDRYLDSAVNLTIYDQAEGMTKSGRRSLERI